MHYLSNHCDRSIKMKIHFKIEGLPALYKMLNKKKKMDIEFPGTTLRDFINGMISRFGPNIKKVLLDKEDEIDMELRVVINMSKYLSYGERMDTPLNDGDTLHIMTVG